jgi:hypothetical protein
MGSSEKLKNGISGQEPLNPETPAYRQAGSNPGAIKFR